VIKERRETLVSRQTTLKLSDDEIQRKKKNPFEEEEEEESRFVSFSY